MAMRDLLAGDLVIRGVYSGEESLLIGFLPLDGDFLSTDLFLTGDFLSADLFLTGDFRLPGDLVLLARLGDLEFERAVTLDGDFLGN